MPGENEKLNEENVALTEGNAEENKELVRFIIFRIAGEWYGVEVSSAREVIRVEGITFLPSSPSHISGIVNLRGNILSVTDLKKVFSFPESELTKESRLIIIESGLLESGLLVDQVAEVIELDVRKIEAILATIAEERAEYLKGVYRLGDKLIGILKVDKILAIQ